MYDWNHVASDRFAGIFRDAEGEGPNRFPQRARSQRKDCQTQARESGHDCRAKKGLDP